MNIVKTWWRKICQPLDGYLWHRNISHHLVRPLLRNLILASGAFILLGGVLFTAFPPLFWFASGLACMTWIFWSWARLFNRISLDNFGVALFRLVFTSFILRLVLLAILLYFALTIFNASPVAIIAGMTTGAFLGIVTYAWHLKHSY